MKNLFLSLIVLAILAFVFVPSAAVAKPPRKSTIFQVIEEAHAKGEIGYETALLNKLYVVHGSDKLDERFKKLEKEELRPVRSATPVFMEVRKNWHRISKQGKQKIKPLLLRPTESGDPADHHEYEIPPSFYNSAGGHFKIWYVTTTDDAVSSADSDGDGVPNYVEEFADILEEVWTDEITNQGFLAPPEDYPYSGGEDDGGDTRYDIYIQNIPYFGYVMFEEHKPGLTPPYNAWSSYMVVDNDYVGTGFSIPPPDAMKVTAAHEFFHAVQYRYDYDEDKFFVEGSAVWMEDVVYDSINDYLRYLPDFFGYPEMPLEVSPLWLYRHYATCIWGHFLEAKYYAGIVQDIWEQCGGTAGKNSLSAMDNVLINAGSSFNEAFKEFTEWNYFTSTRDDGYHYEEASSYPNVAIEDVHSSYPASGSGSIPSRGSNYIELNTSFVESGGALKIIFGGGGTGLPWAAKIIGFSSGSEPHYITEISLSSYGDGAITLISDWLEYSHIMLVPSLGGVGAIIEEDYSYYVLYNPSPTVWSGQIFVTDDVSVPTGESLTIAAGSTVSLNGHCLKSTDGTITDNTNRENWDPDIAVWQGSTLKGRYSTIQSAINAASSGQTVHVGTGTYDEQVSIKAGVDLEGRNSSNTIIDVGLGYVSAVNFNQVNNVKVSGFKLRGYAAVSCYSCCPIIEGNAMYDSEYGIYMMDSSPKIKNNSITDCTYGIMAYNLSWPQIRQPLAGGNTISGDGQGVRCITNSKPELGLDSEGWWGNNNIETTGYDVYVNSGLDYLVVWAKRNWWDGSNPNIYTASGDVVHWYPTLPGPAKIVAGFAVVGAVPAGEEPERQAYSATSLLLSGGCCEEAVEGFKSVIETYPDSRAAESSLCELIFAYRELEREEEALAYIEEISRRVPDSRVGAAAGRMGVPLLSRLGKGTEALALVQELLEVYSGTPYERDLLFQEGMIYRHNLGDTEKAEAVFEGFILKYPDDEISDLAKLELNASTVRPREEIKAAGKTAGGAALLQTYPNPFNAQTAISFALPKPAFVRLEVYNMLGQRVRTVIESQMKAGEHSIIWDGRNQAGREISSGVYLVRLSGNRGGVQTRKIMMLR